MLVYQHGNAWFVQAPSPGRVELLNVQGELLYAAEVQRDALIPLQHSGPALILWVGANGQRLSRLVIAIGL
jgi:hypothetical protein